MELLKLKPTVKSYLWGGTNLIKKYGKLSAENTIAETWELSCHEDGPSIIMEGAEGFKGKSLKSYIAEKGLSILGENVAGYEEFPILVKLIDAADHLSIQVHPDDEFAEENEGQYGKTELWYIVDCTKDAYLYYGFKEEITVETFREKISQGTLEDVLKKVYVQPGDVFFIPAGTVHGIGAGITVAEVQQSSNVTYRVYDYHRKDKEGNFRDLHIEKAVAVASLLPAKDDMKKDSSDNCICRCDYFQVHEVSFHGETVLSGRESSFQHLLILSGAGTIQAANSAPISFAAGDSLFIPAANENVTVQGSGLGLLTWI